MQCRDKMVKRSGLLKFILGCAGSCCSVGFSLAAVSGAYSPLVLRLLLCRTGSRHWASVVMPFVSRVHALLLCGTDWFFLSTRNLPGPGIRPVYPALPGGNLPLHHQGSPQDILYVFIKRDEGHIHLQLEICFTFNCIYKKMLDNLFYLMEEVEYIPLCKDKV